VADARVSLGTEGAFILTDADGRFDFDREVNLGGYNTPRNLSVRVRPPVVWGTTTVVAVPALLERCGGMTAPVVIKLERPPPPPAEVFGDVVGRLTDAGTGAPIEGALVRWRSGTVTVRSTLTNADGNWEMRDLLIGTEPTTSRTIELSFTKAGYWEERRQNVVLRTDAVGDTAVRVDVDMVFEIRVAVTGRVTDLDTGEPLPGALVRHTNAITGFADADGTYRIEGIPLSPRNEPRLVFVTAGGSGFPPTTHWSAQGSIEATVDGDHVVDLPMLRICASSSVTGVVLNAATLQPIAGALVSTDAWFITSTTDLDGRYRIDNIPPGTLNAPRSVRVTASASGFALGLGVDHHLLWFGDDPRFRNPTGWLRNGARHGH
jgi:protocatechuate 3,4-dioxygenase beta subunit